jgi:hypothetical protein
MSNAPVAQAPAGGAAAAGEQRQQSPFQSLASLVLRMGVMYALMMFMKGGKKESETGVLDSKGSLLIKEHRLHSRSLTALRSSRL